MNYFVEPLKKYVVFKGRARRKEYWMFFLFNVIVIILLSIADSLTIARMNPEMAGMLTGLYQLAILLPSIAVGVRRMHDLDRTGWWIIVPIVNLVFSCMEGTKGDNRFGPDPKK